MEDQLTIATTGCRRGFAALERPFQSVEERQSGATTYLFWPGTGRRGDEFTEEFYALDAEVASVLPAIVVANPGADHLVSAIDYTQAPQTDAWIAAGYEVGSTEPIMMAVLNTLGTPEPAHAVSRVTTLQEAEEIAAAHRAIGFPVRQFNQAMLDDPAIRYVQILIEGLPVCVGKIALTSPCAYVTDIVTLPDFRKRGLATALMHALHAEARSTGIPYVALTATAMAQPLYAALGYDVIATQTLWCTPEHE